ncbi:hypothetical protein Y032_0256g373 [Ancylostoma ceylanicum]|uniref:SCP domain-containing protein n=1 Tax=Ancylostoma ceylanicum TaxID=53326 RepID=A0A016SAZ9_9BILA|nr:hypothetical protein Y032_0256g373 [Ancylostoma ceylanicum]
MGDSDSWVVYLLASAEAQNVPDCAKGNSDVQGTLPGPPMIRKHFFELVDTIKKGMRYSCYLEKLAHNLVKEPLECIGSPYKITYADGPTSSVPLGKIVPRWKDQLTKMGRVREFGCNYFQGHNKHRVACVYK